MNNPLSKSKVLIANTAIRMKMILFSFGKPLEKKIVFDSFNGKQYSDNPRAISEYIHDHYPDYQIVWKLYKQQEFNIVPDYVRIVRDESSFLKELSTAFCYIRNVEIKTPFYKRKNQLFIQTWHGDRRFKEILKEKPGAHNLRIYDNDLIDIALSSGKFGDESYDSAFDYHGRIQSIGLPRSELMLSYSSVDIERIKQKVGIHGSEKVLLFAPTFRDNESTEQDVTVDIEQVLQELDNKTGFQWMCLMRAHPSSPGLKNLESTHAIIDVSKYPDMTDILAVSDMLITDYSSSVCDFALTTKPTVMAAYDIEEYIKKYRGFKVRPDEVGFFVAKTQDELIRIINEKTEDDYIEAYKKVNEFFGTNETGKATETICSVIDSWFKNKIENK